MIIVRKVDDNWERLTGIVNLSRIENTCIIHYHDNRPDVVQECEPYLVDDAPADAIKIAQLASEGVLDTEWLSARGLKVAKAFEAPEGKQVVGTPMYVEAGNEVQEVYNLEDIPEPVEPTIGEKLAMANLSREELRSFLGLDE